MKFNISKNKFIESSVIRNNYKSCPIPNNYDAELDISMDAKLTIATLHHESFRISEPNDDIWLTKFRYLGLRAEEIYHNLISQNKAV